MYKKGDIIIVPFPFTDLSGQKVRPALVLACLKNNNDCIVAFITSLKPKRNSSYVIPLSSNGGTGLKVRSWIRIDKIATLTQVSIIGKIGMLTSVDLRQIHESLRKLFEL